MPSRKALKEQEITELCKELHTKGIKNGHYLRDIPFTSLSDEERAAMRKLYTHENYVQYGDGTV